VSDRVGGGRSSRGAWAGLGIRPRILGAVGITALTTLAMGGLGVVQMSVLNDRAQAVYRDGATSLTRIHEVEVAWWTYQAYSARSGMADMPDETLKIDAELAEKNLGSLQKLTKEMDVASLSDRAAQEFEKYRTAADAYHKALAEIMAGTTQYTTDQLNDFILQQKERENTAKSSLSAAMAAQSAAAKSSADDARSAYENARTLTIVLCLAGLVLAAGLSFGAAGSVTRPLDRMVVVHGRIGQGDLSARITDPGPGELGEVASSLNSSLDAVCDTLRLASRSTDHLGQSAVRLRQSAVGIARTTEETVQRAEKVSRQAAAVAESVDAVESSSEQLNGAIREIASTAGQASQVAEQAVSVASDTNDTMSRLGESSREIASFMALINAIAEQTNLLALNATIEAARAGEAGKGFAVVASEVKELAQQTAKATDDISRLVEAIEEGTTSASHSIEEVSEVIRRIQDYQGTVASAVEQQTAATEEMQRNLNEAVRGSQSIATDISELAEATLQNTTRTDETEAAVTDMNELSEELQSSLSRFTV